MSFRRIFFLLLPALLMLSLPVSAQDSSDAVQLSVEAGYDQYFRPNYWLPVRVHVRNTGDSISGRLTVRPDTSGPVVGNAYSAPIDLPTGSEKTTFLYIQARTFPPQIVVELIDNEGVRVAEQTANLRVVEMADVVYVVVSRLGAASIALNDVAPGGQIAVQATWQASEVPSAANALQAINALIVSDVNSDELTVAQRQAIRDWVTMGGHLVVIGGARWRESAAAFTDMLPLIPDDGRSVADVQGVADFAGDMNARLAERAFIATGTLQDGAIVLAETSDGIPLLVRGRFGTGTVDYLAADPTQEPLQSWRGSGDFWFNLFMSSAPQPGWKRGFLETNEAAAAIAILPGVDLLPPVTSMLAYIVAYIVLIGPLNYVILSRLNRREWAWVTIPLLILVFTIVAWTVGFNLRGTEIFVSRLNIVQSSAGSDIARIDQLVGVLSPRRDTYTMAVPDGRFVQVMPGLAQNNFLQQAITQSNADIVQDEDFIAEAVSIDGGIFANFSTSGVIPAPAISGSVTLIYNSPPSEDADTSNFEIRGILRNDSDITLEDAVVMTRNQFYRLTEPLQPGAVVNFSSADMSLLRIDSAKLIPQSSRLQTMYGYNLGSSFRITSVITRTLESTRVVMGDALEITRRSSAEETITTEDELRRRALLRSFMRDQFSASGVGHGAYLIGWSSAQQPFDIQLEGTSYRPIDTALYIIELATSVEKPSSSELVTIQGDQFVWAVRQREQTEGGFDDVTVINPGFLEVRVMPLADARLREVETMTITLDRGSTYGHDVQLQLWDWRRSAWFIYENTIREVYEVANPARYIGPNGMVDIRLELSQNVSGAASSARIRDMQITLTGYF